MIGAETKEARTYLLLCFQPTPGSRRVVSARYIQSVLQRDVPGTLYTMEYILVPSFCEKVQILA